MLEKNNVCAQSLLVNNTVENDKKYQRVVFPVHLEHINVFPKFSIACSPTAVKGQVVIVVYCCYHAYILTNQ